MSSLRTSPQRGAAVAAWLHGPTSGTSMTVRESLYQRGFLHSSSRPQALAARLVPSASLCAPHASQTEPAGRSAWARASGERQLTGPLWQLPQCLLGASLSVTGLPRAAHSACRHGATVLPASKAWPCSAATISAVVCSLCMECNKHLCLGTLQAGSGA